MKRYGFDIDGVLRDFYAASGRVLLAYAPEELSDEATGRLLQPATYWDEKRDLVGPVNWSWFWDQAIYRYQVFAFAPAYEEELEFLDQLQGEKFLITSQPAPARVQTYFWLANNNVNVEGVLHVSRPEEKREFIEALKLDYFVDDHPNTIVDLINAGVTARCYLFDQPWNQGVAVPRIASLEELLS